MTDIKIKIEHLRSMIKGKQAQYNKLSKSVAQELNNKQISVFSCLNKAQSLFDDSPQQIKVLKEVEVELNYLRAELVKAQQHEQYLEETKNVYNLQLN